MTRRIPFGGGSGVDVLAVAPCAGRPRVRADAASEVRLLLGLCMLVKRYVGCYCCS